MTRSKLRVFQHDILMDINNNNNNYNNNNYYKKKYRLIGQGPRDGLGSGDFSSPTPLIYCKVDVLIILISIIIIIIIQNKYYYYYQERSWDHWWRLKRSSWIFQAREMGLLGLCGAQNQTYYYYFYYYYHNYETIYNKCI